MYFLFSPNFKKQLLYFTNYMEEEDDLDLRKFQYGRVIKEMREDIDHAGEELEEDIEKLTTVFSGDRKNHPYMFNEEDLDQPIKRYCSKRSLRIEKDGISVYDMRAEKTARRKLLEQMESFMPKYENKIKDPNSKKFEKGKFLTERETHTSFGGGKFGIPYEKEDEFLKLYAKCIVAGHAMWLIEKNTPVTRMCLDFDFLQKNSWPFNRIEMLAYIVQGEIRKFFPDEDDETKSCLECIVSTAKPTPKTKDNVEYLKTGVHMHWNFFTNRERTLIIRESLIAAMIRHLGKRVAPLNTWDDVIDKSIYGEKGMGLRLMGAEKADECSKCKKERVYNNTDCTICFGEGAINKGRPYLPLMVMDIEGNRNLEKEKYYKLNFEEVIKDTKLRTNKNEIPDHPRFVIPEGAPLPQNDEKKIKKVKLSHPNLDGKSDKKEIRGDTIEITNSEPEWDAIEEFINKHSLPIYKNVIVTDIRTSINRNFYTVNITGEYSRYCHNISREHSSNRIYFYICGDGMVQRCYDKQQDAEMKFGVCSNYSSATIPLTHGIQNLLFKKLKGNEIKEQHENVKDKKLKMLLIMGNELCKNLFNSNWTLEDENGELIMSKSTHSKRFKKDIMLDSMEDAFTSSYLFSKSRGDEMGTKSSEILLKLGFIDSIDKKRKDSITSEDEEDSIYNLESLLFQTLQTCVEITCMMNQEELENFSLKNLY